MRSTNLGRAVAMLLLHTAELGVNVRIVRLKPVAEAAAQHAGGGARRSALHDEMLAVEKIRGVAAIEGKRLESRQRPEGRRSPLPAIAEKIVYAEMARAEGG